MNRRDRCPSASKCSMMCPCPSGEAVDKLLADMKPPLIEDDIQTVASWLPAGAPMKVRAALMRVADAARDSYRGRFEAAGGAGDE